MNDFLNTVLIGILGIIYAYVVMKVMATVYFNTKQRYMRRFITDMKKGEDNGTIDP